MKQTIITGFIIVIIASLSHGNNIITSFQAGLAKTISSGTADTRMEEMVGTDTIKVTRDISLGWEISGTFLGKPLAGLGGPLAGIAIGGKINFAHWVRDSTLTAVDFLGIQGLLRYYTPSPGSMDIFVQSGAGVFVGEYSFTDPDTLDRGSRSGKKNHAGKKDFGLSIGAGLGFSVIEIIPQYTLVFTKEEKSGWFTLNAGVRF